MEEEEPSTSGYNNSNNKNNKLRTNVKELGETTDSDDDHESDQEAEDNKSGETTFMVTHELHEGNASLIIH